MNNEKPLISVVVPAFNEEKYLPACLTSIRNQTFKDFELIVVDNNSTDLTATIAKRYGARVVTEERQGMTPARERGFRESRGSIIARTDADTQVTYNWLEVINNTFTKWPKLIAITRPWLSPFKRIPDKITKQYSYVLSVKLGKLLTGTVHLLGPNMAIRKTAWEKIKVHMDDKQVHEDIDLSCHLSEVGKIRYIPRMQIICSARKIEKNPLKGLSTYVGEYPIRYIRTLYLHKSILRINKKELIEVIKKKIPYLPGLVNNRYTNKKIKIKNPYEMIKFKLPLPKSGKIKFKSRI